MLAEANSTNEQCIGWGWNPGRWNEAPISQQYMTQAPPTELSFAAANQNKSCYLAQYQSHYS